MGAKSPRVIVGPSFGVDVSVLELSSREVMIANCDPISLMPELGTVDSALMSVHEVASDVATSGHSPRFALFDLSLPPRATDHIIQDYWRAISLECGKLGISIVGGHTGRFDGCDYSIVGSASMWTFCKNDDYLTSSMAGDLDDLIMTKTAAFGATAMLAREFPKCIERKVGSSLYLEAFKYFEKMNTVDDSLKAVKVGIHEKGITAIHDVTEGGILAAIVEMGTASGIGCIVDLDAIPVSSATEEIARMFRIDPMMSLGEGSLLIACKPNRTGSLVARLQSDKIPATVIGRFSSKTRRINGETSGRQVKINYPKKDLYWGAYAHARARGWN